MIIHICDTLLMLYLNVVYDLKFLEKLILLMPY